MAYLWAGTITNTSWRVGYFPGWMKQFEANRNSGNTADSDIAAHVSIPPLLWNITVTRENVQKLTSQLFVHCSTEREILDVQGTEINE